MNGFDRLQEQVRKSDEKALVQVVDYLLTRDDMQDKYLKEEKTVTGMRDFIGSKNNEHKKNGWNFVPNEVVYSWAVMYYSLPNKFLGIDKPTNTKKKTTTTKNNIIPLTKENEKIQKKDIKEQLSIFKEDE